MAFFTHNNNDFSHIIYIIILVPIYLHSSRWILLFPKCPSAFLSRVYYVCVCVYTHLNLGFIHKGKHRILPLPCYPPLLPQKFPLDDIVPEHHKFAVK